MVKIKTDDNKFVSKQHILLEIQVYINTRLYHKGVIPKEIYETVNDSLLKKIKNEISVNLSSIS